MTNLNNTAILVFANSAKAEMQIKPIQKGAVLFDKLTQETLQKVKKTGLPYFHISEQEQKGKTFGERFTKAIQTVFENGFENIITIGNDTPQLKTAHLLQASNALQTRKTVLGPSVDGGFYLMGIHKSNFDQETFKRLPWQRFSLFHRISSLLEKSGHLLFQLPVLNDIDTIKDLKRLASFKKSISTAVLRIITVLLHKGIGFQTALNTTFNQILLQQPYNKGSPALFQY